ncbi:MAG: hypothetical protein HYU38_07180 [Candidatus Tectomicrobia bacterium]|nr:hypothetical protein [Candidatus Tectomicrobia bacterium]
MPDRAYKLEDRNAVERGEDALFAAISEGMTIEQMAATRQEYVKKGVPKELVNRMFPSLPPLR